MEKIKRLQILPGEMILPLGLILLVNYASYFLTRPFTTKLYHYDMTLPIDEGIPLVPWTVVIYFGCYLFWIVNYVLACRQNRDEAFRFCCAEILAKFACMCFYILLPTTNVRPAVEGTTVFDELMRLLYQMDAADNLFPSIHCLVSWFCVIGVRKNPNIPLAYKVFSVLLAVAVFVSTLTTKQHVIVDIIGAVVLAEGAYLAVGATGLSRAFRRMAEWMYAGILRTGKHFQTPRKCK